MVKNKEKVKLLLLLIFILISIYLLNGIEGFSSNNNSMNPIIIGLIVFFILFVFGFVGVTVYTYNKKSDF